MKNNMTRRDCYAWISSVEGMYCDKIHRLVETLGTVENVFEANEISLRKIEGISEEDVLNIITSRETFDPEKYYGKLENIGVKFISIDEELFPNKLKKYEKCPYFFYYKGTLPDAEKPIVAMVGARACSNYGRTVSRQMGREFSDAGIQVISGMARGVDTYSLLGALEGGEKCFAVLGCGVDVCYPSENIELYERIIANGGIISEYPPGSKPLSWHFPQRNRIISGMADKIAVIEAKEKSGSLITVEWALEQGKDVFALPGRINDELSKGCNRLIKAGAGVLTEAEDIINELNINWKKIKRNEYVKENLLEKDLALLYSELSLSPKSIVELMEKTHMGYQKIADSLLQLQLAGLVEQPVDNYYARTVL